MTKPPATHTAYVLKRETRTRRRWISIGSAQIQSDGPNGVHYVHLDSLPIGGFSGSFMLQPISQQPPDPQLEPERPGEEEH